MFVRSIRCSSFAIAKEAHFSELTKPKRVFFSFPRAFFFKVPMFSAKLHWFSTKTDLFSELIPLFFHKVQRNEVSLSMHLLL